MSIDELERSGTIRKLPIDRKKVNDSLDLAKRDLNIARNMLDENCDWAFSIAYHNIAFLLLFATAAALVLRLAGMRLGDSFLFADIGGGANEAGFNILHLITQFRGPLRSRSNLKAIKILNRE